MEHRVDVEVLLGHLGIRAERTGGKWVARCPNPSHDDSHPSWAIIDRPGHDKHGSHFCQACRFGGGPWELAAAVWGLPLEAAGKELLRLGLGEARLPAEPPRVTIRDPATEAPSPAFRLPLGVTIPEPGGRWYQPALKYLLRRGVALEQVHRWHFGYATRGRLVNRVVLPVRDADGGLITYTARAITDSLSPRYQSGEVSQGARPRRAIWGEEHFDWDRDVATVAEGVFSALALERVGAPNPCALLGSDLTPEKARILSRFRVLILATDPDPAGDRVARAFEALGRRVMLIRARPPVSPDDADPSDLRATLRKAAPEFFS